MKQRGLSHLRCVNVAEHGPFRIAEDGASLNLYNYSWNRFANVIYVEQPSGVGHSFSKDESHYVCC